MRGVRKRRSRDYVNTVKKRVALVMVSLYSNKTVTSKTLIYKVRTKKDFKNGNMPSLSSCSRGSL